jgi:hypothetical protein
MSYIIRLTEFIDLLARLKNNSDKKLNKVKPASREKLML